MRTTKIGSALVAGCILVGAALAQAGSGSSRRAGSGGRRAPRRVAATKAVEKGSPHAAFTALLAKHVQDGRVSYRGFQEDEAALDRYLGYFARTDPSGLSHKEQLAFWINAYNAFTIKLILQKYPDIKSIKDFWGPWDKRDWVVNGRKVTEKLVFEPTGSWETWKTATITTDVLFKGDNVIQLQANGDSGPDLDEMTLTHLK